VQNVRVDDDRHTLGSMIIFPLWQGLCGTFSGNVLEDFLTPERDIEEDHAAFAAR
jgi:hypothetical protein